MSDRSEGFRPAMVKGLGSPAGDVAFAKSYCESIAEDSEEPASRAAADQAITWLNNALAILNLGAVYQLREMRGSLSRQKRNAFGVIIQAENPA